MLSKHPPKVAIAPPLEIIVANPLQMYCIERVVIQEVIPNFKVIHALIPPTAIPVKRPANTDTIGFSPITMDV